MQPQPIYTPENVRHAYHLRFGWTGWPSGGELPDPPVGEAWQDLVAGWEKDGLRLLEQRWTREQVQMTFSTTPEVSPELVASRAKGRLQHALRMAGTPVAFARNFAVRSIGDNTRAAVAGYVANQVVRSDLADPRFRETLAEFAVRDDTVDLTQPTATGSGRYWYNLHLVLVVAERQRFGKRETLAALREMSVRVGRGRRIGIAVLSFMPDHLHAVLRPEPALAPATVAMGFQNNLAWAVGPCAFWEFTYYVGTFGEYTMGAVR